MAREIPQLCNEWHYWNFKLHRAIEVQSAATHKICLPICNRSQTEVLRYFHLAWECVFRPRILEGRHRKPKGIQFANRAGRRVMALEVHVTPPRRLAEIDADLKQAEDETPRCRGS